MTTKKEKLDDPFTELALAMRNAGRFLVDMREKPPGYFTNDQVLTALQAMIENGILDMFHRTLILAQLLVEAKKLPPPDYLDIPIPPEEETGIILPPSFQKRH